MDEKIAASEDRQDRKFQELIKQELQELRNKFKRQLAEVRQLNTAASTTVSSSAGSPLLSIGTGVGGRPPRHLPKWIEATFGVDFGKLNEQGAQEQEVEEYPQALKAILLAHNTGIGGLDPLASLFDFPRSQLPSKGGQQGNYVFYSKVLLFFKAKVDPETHYSAAEKVGVAIRSANLKIKNVIPKLKYEVSPERKPVSQAIGRFFGEMRKHDVDTYTPKFRIRFGRKYDKFTCEFYDMTPSIGKPVVLARLNKCLGFELFASAMRAVIPSFNESTFYQSLIA